MQIKEKPKNKMKINNNKQPLPKIKYSTSHNQTLTKLKSINNQPPSNLHNNQYIEQYNLIQSNLYKPKESKQKEEQKFNPKTNLKIKNLYELKNNNKTNYTKNNENKNNIPQNNLKYLLKEFGLSEYIRKLNEFGYDNNNYLKIGTLTRKNFNNLLTNIHIFPGHTVKMEKFYEYLKKLNMTGNNHNHNYNYNNNNNYMSNNFKKRKLNYNSIYGINNGNKNNPNNNYNHYYNYDNYNINKHSLNINNRKNNKCLSPRSRPRTSHVNGFSKPKIRIRNNFSGNKLMKRKIENYSNYNTPYFNNSLEGNNNALIHSYLNDNKKLILNHKLNNNNINLLDIQNKYNENELINNNNFNQNNKDNLLYNSYNNYNNIENQKELEDKINENIERMLNYYMVQLNDKLDKSYETVEDSSLSCIVTSQINDTQNINNININKLKNKNIENKKILPNYKLPSISNIENLNSNNKNSNKNVKYNNKINENKNIINNNKENDKVNDKENDKEKNTLEEKIKNNDNINININKKEELIKEKIEKKKRIEEEIKNEENRIKEEYIKDIKKFSEHETSTKSKDSKEHEIEEDYIIKEQNPINLKEKEKKLNNKDKETSKQLLLEEDYLLNDKYSLEQNIYDTLRLNKSMDNENKNKDTLKFDIEFMCRCLGLALMRHFEQGNEKQHITELYTPDKDLKYNFINTDFNKNLKLIKDFYNIHNDINKDSKLGDLNVISILEKFSLENNDIDNDDIDIMKHIKKTGDEKIIEKDDISEESFKFRSGLADFENEFKFIGEFFAYPKKKSKNYQNLSENTKKILCKDLSYIKEMDSEMNKTGNSNTVNNNSKYNNDSNIKNEKILEDDVISKEDSKNNQENKNKILDEEDKDEDYNYEDEFLNDDNINDKNDKDDKDKNEENNNNNENKKENNNNNINNINNDEKDNNIDLKDKNNNDKEEEIKNNINEEKDDMNKKIIENKEKNINDNKNEININDDLNDNKIIPKDNIEKILNINEIKKDENKIENEKESNYIIDAENINKFKEYLIKQFEIFDDDFLYYTMSIPTKRFMAPPDPQSIFEFCANIMILTKMEKEVIIISLIYIERLIFNTGIIINSRNWRKIIFISLIIASKIWDDDSLENIHYSQVFTHLKVGEINLLERTFLELINYKIFVKFSEYMKYYFAIKNLALKYNFNGEKIVPVSVEKMMKIQEYAYQMQKRIRRKISLNNSADF